MWPSGDTVKADDPLITLESDKATMDVPAPQDGTVGEILIKIGDKVSEGTPILRLKDGAGASPDAPPAAAPVVAQQVAQQDPVAQPHQQPGCPAGAEPRCRQ